MKEEMNVLFNVDDGRTIEIPLKKILDKIIQDYQCEIIESADECSCSFTESNNHCECDGIYEDNIVTGYSVSGTKPKLPDNSEALREVDKLAHDITVGYEYRIHNSVIKYLSLSVSKIRALIGGEAL